MDKHEKFHDKGVDFWCKIFDAKKEEDEKHGDCYKEGYNLGFEIYCPENHPALTFRYGKKGTEQALKDTDDPGNETVISTTYYEIGSADQISFEEWQKLPEEKRGFVESSPVYMTYHEYIEQFIEGIFRSEDKVKQFKNLNYKKILIIELGLNWTDMGVHFFNKQNINEFEKSEFLKDKKYGCLSGIIISCRFSHERKTHFINNLHANTINKLNDEISFINLSLTPFQ